jgi:hypothetical protein
VGPAGVFGLSRGATRVIVALLIAAYVAGWAVAPLLTGYEHSDLDLFFWPSAQIAAHGHPLAIYAAQASAVYPNANGPLGLIPLLPIAVVGNAMGWANSVLLRVGAVYAITALFTVLLAWEAMRVVGRSHGLVTPLVVAAAILLAPTLLTSIGDYGHIEQPLELWLVLLASGAALKGRPAVAGVGIGLAILTRTTALLDILPIGLFLLSMHGRKAATIFFAVAASTGAIGFAPFFIADASALVHSLVTYRADLPIGGGSLWVAIRGGPLGGFVQRGDGYLIVGTATALSAAIAWRRGSMPNSTASLLGALTVASICFPMLAKTVFPYYFLEPYVFSIVWWIAAARSALNWRIVAPLAITAATLLSRFTSGLLFSGTGQAAGIASSGLLLAATALVMTDLVATRLPRLETSSAAPTAASYKPA